MEITAQFDRIRGDVNASSCALDLLCESINAENLDDYLNRASSQIAKASHSSSVMILKAERGNWLKLYSWPQDESMPDRSILANVLDRETIGYDGSWAIAPLLHRSSDAELMAIKQSDRQRLSEPEVDALAATFGVALFRFRQRIKLNRRIRRLEAILDIAAGWNANLEMESLLTNMAETSTRLLGAERASIFLWDRNNKTLVGRPALGVEENELRIPDDAGIVGEVVQTGETRRVDEKTSDAKINREVDKQLGFETRTILCVPLRGKNDKVLGAFEMINKHSGNFTNEDEIGLVELAAHAVIALENTQQFRQLLDSRKQIAQQAAEEIELIGESHAMRNLKNTTERVAKTDLSLLVLGENGTGKEVVSRLVHYLSSRHDEPFVAVNCAALTETLLESELFGHEKGAFTDAHEARAGKFELADGGTLFLDEIGDLSLSGQAKLLRVLEEKVVVRVGGSLPIKTDTRVIAATNQDLTAMVQERRFREDLFFRLNVVTINMPPLRDRPDDIELLANHFLKDFSVKARRKAPVLSADAIKRLRQHSWPGNVRELRNLMERIAYLSQDDRVDADDLAFIMSSKADSAANISTELTLGDATKKFQVDYIHKQIELAAGNMSEAAKRMGLHRSNLYRKMRQLEMSEPDEQVAD